MGCDAFGRLHGRGGVGALSCWCSGVLSFACSIILLVLGGLVSVFMVGLIGLVGVMLFHCWFGYFLISLIFFFFLVSWPCGSLGVLCVVFRCRGL